MKNFVFGFLFISSSLFAQDKVQGDISTKDTAKLSILGVYQEQFPNVSVVFRAEKNNGDPVFGLGIDDMNVAENGEECEVISLCELSKKKPINIGVVLDHSGSMYYDEKQLWEMGIDPWFDLDYDSEGFPIWPEGYVAPIDMAKEALNSFVATFNFEKDKIGVVGFSSEVDKVIKPSKNEKKIKKMINSMEADGSTAFYDALIRGVEIVSDSDELSVLVALTDGNDNNSKSAYEDVVELAQEKEIPIYLIGLGDVNTDSLQMLANATDGQFFYANSASALTEIYEKISTKLQAFYDMVYRSPNLEADAGERTLEITFVKDGIHLITEEERFDVDEHVIKYIEEKEAEKQREYFMYGGIGLVVLIAGGLIFYFTRRKRKPKLKITKVYPNPTSGKVTVEIENNESDEGTLSILDQGGNQVRQESIASNSEIDLQDLPNGLYMLSASFDGNTSEAVKVLVKR
jgi:Ca-activated chloride channel family protein